MQYQDPTYHAHQLPDRIARLCAYTQPVLCARAIESNFLEGAHIDVLIVQVRGTLGEGVVGADNFERLRTTGGSVEGKQKDKISFQFHLIKLEADISNSEQANAGQGPGLV